MNNQLSSIAVQYRKFSKGQYIGPDQFNEFLDYFEDQDRLSRMLLQGVGIVCGFKPTLIYKDRLLNSIQLSQGVAVTTDGDLLTLNKTKKVSEELYMSDLKTVDVKNKEFTHFKAYDNFKVKYPHFMKVLSRLSFGNWQQLMKQN
jgi:5S rRNA maturation endonuclease (ribonuclease M5)